MILDNLQLVIPLTDFVFAFAVLLAGAYAFQRSRRAALFVALGGVIGILCSLVQILSLANHRLFESDFAFYLLQLENVVRHVALFGGLALALLTIAREQRA